MNTRITIASLFLVLSPGCKSEDTGAAGTTSSGGGNAETSDCLIGTLDCPCSHGGSCITGLVCEEDVCVPGPPTTSDGDGGSSGVTASTTDDGGSTSLGTSDTGTSGTGTGDATGTGTSGTTGGGISMSFDAIADTFVQGSAPDFNTGSNFTISVHWTPHHGLVQFDAAEIASFVSGGTVASANLDLVVSGNGGGWDPPNPIAIHRMDVAWTESGATYNCAIDSNPGNMTPNCMGAEDWDLDGGSPPYQAATDSVDISDATSGTVRFDVTTDVQAFAAGTTNYGWMIIKTDDQLLGGISFHSREGTVAPQLTIVLQ